jgi:2-dehydro-3-deoxygluconokinase
MLLQQTGMGWLHTGGIFATLSESTPEVIEEAMIAARSSGTIVSCDLNYRPSLWEGIGGKAKAQEVNRRLAQYVDVMLGNEEDFTACLGFQVEGVDKNLSSLNVESFKKMITQVIETYPNFQVVATTLRTVKSASINDWGAVCWADKEFYEAEMRENLEILDRVGGGCASGLIYGLLMTGDPQTAVNYGAAHGALAMTTPGDTTMATLKEVEKIMAGGNARVVR